MDGGRTAKPAYDRSVIDLREALDRTLLLMRGELVAETPDAALIEALTATQIALVADEHTLTSLSAQTAFATIAMLCARSGHRVYLLAPDIPLAGRQSPAYRKSLGTCAVGRRRAHHPNKSVRDPRLPARARSISNSGWARRLLGAAR